MKKSREVAIRRQAPQKIPPLKVFLVSKAKNQVAIAIPAMTALYIARSGSTKWYHLGFVASGF